MQFTHFHGIYVKMNAMEVGKLHFIALKFFLFIHKYALSITMHITYFYTGGESFAPFISVKFIPIKLGVKIFS